MSAQDIVHTELPALGWELRRNSTPRDETWYRWRHDEQGQYREELVVLYDSALRVSCWSVWRTYRIVSPDHETGRRERLIEYAGRDR